MQNQDQYGPTKFETVEDIYQFFDQIFLDSAKQTPLATFVEQGLSTLDRDDTKSLFDAATISVQNSFKTNEDTSPAKQAQNLFWDLTRKRYQIACGHGMEGMDEYTSATEMLAGLELNTQSFSSYFLEKTETLNQEFSAQAHGDLKNGLSYLSDKAVPEIKRVFAEHFGVSDAEFDLDVQEIKAKWAENLIHDHAIIDNAAYTGERVAREDMRARLREEVAIIDDVANNLPLFDQ